MREIESSNACFQSVMKASYVMKAARHACTHNHSCILLGYGLLVLGVHVCVCVCDGSVVRVGLQFIAASLHSLNMQIRH